jgi:glycosyltransferase involved in cell wall biosynthesis
MKRNPNLISDLKTLKKLKAIIKEFKPDIVHTHASKAGALGRRAAKQCKVPVIVHTFHGHIFHSYFSFWKTQLYRIIEKRLAKISNGIIAISPKQKEELSETFKICHPNKIEVVPLGFDLSPFHQNKEEKRKVTRAEHHLKDSELAIGIIGRLAPIKNHDLFLDSVEKVATQTTKELVIFIVGDGEENLRISNRVTALKNKGIDVRMTSWIHNISDFNAGMDLICLSSKNEGTPVSLIEAQAAGIPIISTNVGGIKDVILPNETGVLVNEMTVDAYSKALLELIEDEKKRKLMSQKGWSFVEEKFQYPILMNNMDNYYKKLLLKAKR